MSDFVHLHNHTMYSLLDGLSKIDRMVAYAKENGMHSIAITDHGVMYGAIKFYQSCKKHGIKPIIGCEIYITKGSRLSKDAADKDYNHLILLAENNTGYVNLMKIVSSAWTEGYYYKPRTDLELLRRHHEGLICLSACVGGFISEPLLNGQQEEAEKRARELSGIFGPDHFYLEIQRHIHVPPQEKLNTLLVGLSRSLGLPLVATNDNHYTKPEDAKAQELLLCIQTQTTLDAPNRKLSMIDSPDFYLKTPQEMEELFNDLPEAIENTVKIAERCNVDIKLGKWHMPQFSLPEGLTAVEFLRKQVFEGAKERYDQLKDYDVTTISHAESEGADDPQDIDIPTAEQIIRRINYELSVIEKKGYATYFLVVADFVKWAKEHGIAVGPGRGSGAGSVVSYSLTITDIDPFFFKLPFERFLNPLRPSAPDIDLDFADTRRAEVIQYVTEKYGADKVAQIITFGTMEAKGAVRDVGRALGMSFSETDRIAKTIPPGWQGHAMELETAMKESPELKRMYEAEADTKRLIDYARQLEGVTRHASVHAAGVVIAPSTVTDYTPVQREPNGGEKLVTQYDMLDVGEDGVGLLKMDFLGLRNLTIIEESIRFIRENRGVEINSSKIPYDDAKAYELLASGETTGIFQFESAGMRRYIKELKPTNIFDVSAMVALYRPGPMANIPEYIARKRDSTKIHYFDERLHDVHRQSLGMLVYQDDVLLMAITLAGYTWLDADKFRKAMGKKIPEEMKKQEEKFISGAQAYGGLSPQRAKELYALVAPFAGYGFNKAHAACYATIAYRTAYLKANYPVEFMTALLTAESRGTTGPQKDEKIAQVIAECKRLQLQLYPPDINTSQEAFTIENGSAIRFGLSAIKNIGDAAIADILAERKTSPFTSLDDFAIRMIGTAVNKKTIESLIKAGAMDRFGNRAAILTSYPETMEKVAKLKKQRSEGQTSLFGDEAESQDTYTASPQVTDIEDFTISQKLAFEKELLGIYLSAHPQDAYIDIIRAAVSHELESLEDQQAGAHVTVGGYIASVRKIFTKKSNAEMAFIRIENHRGTSVECVVFPKVYEQYKDLIAVDGIVLVSGKLDSKNDQQVILADAIRLPHTRPAL